MIHTQREETHCKINITQLERNNWKILSKQKTSQKRMNNYFSSTFSLETNLRLNTLQLERNLLCGDVEHETKRYYLSQIRGYVTEKSFKHRFNRE